jgi:hypothetical protein
MPSNSAPNVIFTSLILGKISETSGISIGMSAEEAGKGMGFCGRGVELRGRVQAVYGISYIVL